MNPYVDRDLYYRELSDKERVEAGFYETGSNFQFGKVGNEESAPYHFFKNEIFCHLSEVAIIYMTGCFGPFHKGHLRALEAAEVCLGKAGYKKVIAYIAPDHDSYMATKTNEWPIDKRIYELRESLGDSHWIKLDLWPSLFVDKAINFTEAYEHFKNYIHERVGFKIPVFYVCGGDNARFVLAFKNRGNCIVVNRPQYEREVQKYGYLADNKRIFIANCKGVFESSTNVRKFFRSKFDNPVHLILRIGDDPRERQIAETLKPFYNSMELVSAADQREQFKKLEGPIISLDPLVKGEYNLEVSRHFDAMGMDLMNFGARPDSKPIEEQIISIPKGKYALYDDDITTGTTMEWVRNFLMRFDIQIIDYLSFTRGQEGVEILDARDFIYGKNNGLVINGKRYIYSLPNVIPSVRASVKNSMEFSRQILLTNLDFASKMLV